MANEPLNLNTESNDIAGNRIDGPEGNTAARPGAPNAGVGIPGGPPAQQSAAGGATPDVDSPGAPASSESLVDAEMGAGKGAVEDNPDQQENKEADPADLTTGDTYGGNFSNSTQDSFRDQARRDNQDSDPNRGEFGAQNLAGTTHGGFGNQNRVVEYEPHNSAEDQYYGGAGRPGVQDNAYRRYDGRDERPDVRTEYGFEAGANSSATSAQATDQPQASRGAFSAPNGDNRNQPDRADANSARQVDNGSVQSSLDTGFAADYGHTSLRGANATTQTGAQASQTVSGEHRNQTEDYLPVQGGFDKQSRPQDEVPAYSTKAPVADDSRGERPDSSTGYGDRGREEPRRQPDFATGDDRNGYVQRQANNGDASQGIGSRGGSYNDPYDDGRPGQTGTSPAKGDLRSEDMSGNYGGEARQENRSDGEANDADHGAPRRNAGRDGEGDE